MRACERRASSVMQGVWAVYQRDVCYKGRTLCTQVPSPDTGRR